MGNVQVWSVLSRVDGKCFCACRSPSGKRQFSHRLLWALSAEQRCGGGYTQLQLSPSGSLASTVAMLQFSSIMLLYPNPQKGWGWGVGVLSLNSFCGTWLYIFIRVLWWSWLGIWWWVDWVPAIVIKIAAGGLPILINRVVSIFWWGSERSHLHVCWCVMFQFGGNDTQQAYSTPVYWCVWW